MTILLTGIDTLEIGYNVGQYYFEKEYIQQLDHLLEESLHTKNKNEYPTIELAGNNFMLRKCPSRWKYTIFNSDMSISFSPKATNGLNYQDIHATFRSEYLWREHWLVATTKFTDWLNQIGYITDHKISRVDYCTDITEPIPNLTPTMEEIVTRAYSKHNYNQFNLSGQTYKAKGITMQYRTGTNINLHNKRNDFTGWVLGKGPLMNRTYDKIEEIEITHKQWFKELWKQENWNEKQPVTRIEFQCRRDFLRETSPKPTNTLEDLIYNCGGTWEYLTSKWLKLCTPKDNTQRTRWKLTPFWQEVNSAKDKFLNNYELNRHYLKQPKYDSLMLQAEGCLATATALKPKQVTNPNTGEILNSPITELLNHTESEEWQEKVLKRRSQYAHFN